MDVTMKTRHSFQKMYPNPHNINKFLKLKTKVVRVSISNDIINIDTDGDLDTHDLAQLEEFLKVGINSIWRFVSKQSVKDEDEQHGR